MRPPFCRLLLLLLLLRGLMLNLPPLQQSSLCEVATLPNLYWMKTVRLWLGNSRLSLLWFSEPENPTVWLQPQLLEE